MDSTEPDTSTCQHCGRPLPARHGTGRKRLYCGPTCRSAARRVRERAADPALLAGTNVNQELTGGSRQDYLDDVTVAAADPAQRGTRIGRELLAELLAGPGTGTPLDTIALVQGAAQCLADGLRAAVTQARAAGHSWAEVGRVLGTTRQAAF